MLPCIKFVFNQNQSFTFFNLQGSAEYQTRRVTVTTNTNISSTNISLSNWFNLATVLNETPNGKAIIKYYEDLLLPET